MKFEAVRDLIRGIPFITKPNARYLYDLILRERRTNILELGIAHGAGTCYIAAALEELGAGSVTAVDLLGARFNPSAEELTSRCGLAAHVEIVRYQTGYNWFLHDKIKERSSTGWCEPMYDLCILDGAKNWTLDSSAFFLADKLLKTGSKFIFDDYKWTYAEADKRRAATDGVTHRSLSPEELVTPHIKEVINLLVLQHPNYSKVMILDDGSWVVCEKTASDAKIIEISTTQTWRELGRRFLNALGKAARRLSGR
jgi:predicted O-methyltransferase YrrM